MKKSLVIAVLLASGAAQAYEAGDIVVRAGAATVAPDETSSDVRVDSPALGTATGVKVGVEDDTKLGVATTYMVTPMIGVELLAAFPFEHDIVAAGDVAALGKLGATKHLPPTLSVQFYPMSSASRFQPYVGAGVNYTNFFEETTTDTLTAAIGAVADIAAGTSTGVVASSTELKLDDSVSYALSAGFDYMLDDHFGINAGVWYIDIDTTAEITADTNAGPVKASVDVEIDPWAYMIGFSYKL